ncbi:MAG: DNA-binding transcriptional dual regulator [Gammaproteobacteria bacterium]|jgi:Fur family ferric uptake transcriptional regulator|nr:DNA-binding transcriptional dual regulator [Gammaproteobacteria bacterium]
MKETLNITLRQAGLRVTSPRIKIWHLLETLPQRHLSAEEVYQALREMGDEVSLATVYRVLNQFAEAGLVIRHHFEEGHSVFELDEGTHHDHLVCVQCGKVAEFVDEAIEERQSIIAKEAGFSITDHHLTIYGVCSACCSAANLRA